MHNEKIASDVALGKEQDDTEHVDSDSSTNLVVQVEGTAVKNRNVVWKYFRKVAGWDGVRVQCKVCDKTIKTTGRNTTNLLSYLKTTHSNKYFEVKQKVEEEQKKRTKSTKQRSSKTSQQNPSQATLTGIATSKAKLDTSSVRYRRITQKIAGMMIHDFQPFAFVEDKGFTELMEQLDPRYDIPHRIIFSRSVIPGIYEEAKWKVENTFRFASRH